MILTRFARKYIHESCFKNSCRILRKVRQFATLKQNQNERTMAEVKTLMMERLGLEMGYHPQTKSREHLLKYEPKFEDLPSRSLQDSFTSAIVPLSTDKRLQDQYISLYGDIRLGKLMEDMDLFAVWVCHQHLYIPNLPSNIALPYTFVTICVDKIDFTEAIRKPDQDVRLSGQISWVGRSSMEVVVWLEQNNDGNWKKLTKALFLMAARNAINSKAAPVNPIKPANNEEQEIYAGGLERKNRRMQFDSVSLYKTEPNPEEEKIIHNLFKRTIALEHHTLNKRFLPENCKWLTDTKTSTFIVPYPENRNAQYTVFGGFLMRHGLEISWACAFMFCGSRPKLKHICDISFKQPVMVSSFIKMSAHVIYTEANFIQVIVVTDIANQSSTTEFTSNVFYYTYWTKEKVPEVIPKTYHEAIWYLDGRRKLLYSLCEKTV